MNKLFDYFPQNLKESVVEYRISTTKAINRKNTVTPTVTTDFAFPKVKKLPLESKKNILSAITHFFNVKGVSTEDRASAYKKIIQKAGIYEICTIVFVKQYEAYLENINSNESKK